MNLDPESIGRLLADRSPGAADALFAEADRVRKECVGDAVHLRGLVEISNHCRRLCAYCGVNASRPLARYRMTADEIAAAAGRAKRFGYGSVVLQAGEDPALDAGFVARVVRRIKGETGLAITLSLGERDDADYAAWREAGADRYLLRFETGDPELYARIHPGLSGKGPESRLDHLRRLRRLGYEIGGGVMAGIPGQTWESLARDIGLFRELDLDMIGVGPYLSHPDTEMGRRPDRFPPAAPGEQAIPDEETTCRVVALARLVRPDANIPATTALAVAGGESGRRHGLARGANVIMPNLTPPECRALYEIYPAKSAAVESAEEVNKQIRLQLAELGRSVGVGPGGRRR